MGKKRTFQVLDEMNIHDTEHGTMFVGVCPDFIEGHTAKGGAHCTMGIPANMLVDIMTDKSMAILVIVNKQEYFKRLNDTASNA